MKCLKQLKFISPLHLSVKFHKNNIWLPWIADRDFHRTGPGSITGHYMWNLWWKTWHCGRFLSVFFGINHSRSLYQCSITIIHLSNMTPYKQSKQGQRYSYTLYGSMACRGSILQTFWWKFGYRMYNKLLPFCFYVSVTMVNKRTRTVRYAFFSWCMRRCSRLRHCAKRWRS